MCVDEFKLILYQIPVLIHLRKACYLWFLIVTPTDNTPTPFIWVLIVDPTDNTPIQELCRNINKNV